MFNARTVIATIAISAVALGAYAEAPRVSATSGTIERFVFHPEMSWPDTLAWGPDGALFIVSNHLNVWINFDNPSVPNFRIWKIPGIGKSYVAP